MSKLTRYTKVCKQNRAPPTKIIVGKKILFLEENMYENYLEDIHRNCRRRNLSVLTEKHYIEGTKRFFAFIGENRNEFTLQDVNDYIDSKIEARIKPQTINSEIANIRFFYQRVLKQTWDYDEVLKQKEKHKLPAILSKDEVDRLIDSAPTLKYKAIFAVIYSSGLRISEAVHLNYSDISRKNKQVHIRETKNRWERYSILSDKCLDILTEYWYAYGKPMDVLFLSDKTGSNISASAVERTFRKMRDKAGYPKDVTVHTLRHCFATHLADDGVDIRVIQHLMGHNSVSSTGLYLHLTNYRMQGIKSPYDVKVGEDDDK